MLPLRRVFADYDLGLLRVIAGMWGVELAAGEARGAADELAARLLQAEAAAEMVAALPAAARAALEHLGVNGGALPVAQAIRQFGEVRQLGPARRDREQPWLNPASPLEALWYRGLIGRAFAESRPAPQEYFFIPSDLAPLLPPPGAPAGPRAPGRPAPEPPEFLALGSAIVDDVCTTLAYLQNTARDSLLRRELKLDTFLITPASRALALHLAGRLALLDGEPPRPDPRRARPFLEAARAEQHRRLAEAWQTDPTWNDLVRVPGLDVGGTPDDARTPPNDPLAARQAILAFLARVPPGEWWALESCVQAIREQSPDFQRPAGDYDSWYLRDAAGGEPLRGFAHWDRVEGGLIRYLICGPLHWLGLVDISPGAGNSPEAAMAEAAFRVTWAGRALLHGEAWPADGPAAAPRVHADGSLTVSAAVQPYERFTLARCADWERLELQPEGAVYTYRISAGSLERAQTQGVGVRHVLAFLSRAAANPLPRQLGKALERWEREGTEAAVGEMVVLQVKSAEVLERLRQAPKVRALLGRALGPAAVEVRRQDAGKLRAALLEAGLLADFHFTRLPSGS